MTGGKVLIKPFIKRTVVVCVKVDHLSIGERKRLITARCTHSELRAKPEVSKKRKTV